MRVHTVGRVRYYYDSILASWGVYKVDVNGDPCRMPDGTYIVKYFGNRAGAEDYVHTICDCRRTI